MKKYIVIILTIIIIFFYSCDGNGEYSPDDLSSNFAAAVKSDNYNEDTEAQLEESTEEVKSKPPKEIAIPARSIKKIERKLIKEGNIKFETDDCSVTKKMIHEVANSLNGYLARDDEYSYEHQIEHNITIRVPSDNFDQLLAQISQSVKKIEDQNISVKDVTEEYVDISARLVAKKTVEKRYLELLKKAYSVEDVLLVESELARLREQIESREGRLRYLKDQVSLSTLHITFYQKLEVEEPNFEFFTKTADGFNNGFTGLMWVFIGLVNIWPLILFIVFSVWLIVRLVKKSSQKKR